MGSRRRVAAAAVRPTNEATEIGVCHDEGEVRWASKRGDDWAIKGMAPEPDKDLSCRALQCKQNPMVRRQGNVEE